ncbi:MAG: hypothetical protein JETT_2724 [Candidatus Jettenia ecosi]|uniref:Uncharacterized protein n=1 Tax=Candidatus Jettenia ecosi TaxID=2494326 RepID=A0A533Q8N0_9BACT|nr:MAG: hypothetical protein JETT_2724 [Candidatus Jettenia ecosi]
MNKIIGCSFDGLKDRFFINGVQSPKSNDFCLANVILPSQYGGKFLVGDEAKQSRISCGFHWPPDAGILEGHLRRIHVSWAWRLLVDAKDKFVRWNAGNGVSFNISKILAEHIAGQLGEDGKDADYVIVAIPNHLDEFGQESLIKDLASLGIISHKEKKRPYLLWRPVAAALAWLDKVQEQFEKPIPPEDFILVVHVGPDCIEFTTFRLRERVYNNKRFVIPLREQPKVEISLCGIDWVTELIQHAFKTDNLMVIWQVFTNFPEIWETLAQRPWNKEKLPRVWSRGNSNNTSWEWDLWEPEETLRDIIWQLEVGASQCLEELTEGNCDHRRSVLPYNSWQELLQEGVRNSLNNHKDGKLRGAIFSGPLVSINPSFWLKDIIYTFESRGLCAMITQETKLDQIWAPSFNEDIVSKGAYIYGERLSRGEPTYFDTVTQLYILANKRGKHDWVPLLEEGKLEVDGGCELSNPLGKIFSLNRRSKTLNTLNAWLKKGENTVFKKTQFHFPHAPSRDMPLDVHIRVASAGGFAQVELIPEEKEFLGGTRIFLDYNNMENTETLPQLKLGFPLITNMEVDPNDTKIRSQSFQQLCNGFHNTGVYSRNYYECARRFRDELRRPIRFQNNFGDWISGKIVNQDGKTVTSEGKKIIHRISKKLGDDLDIVVSRNLGRRIEQVICSAATWLFGAASTKIDKYLREKLETEIIINNNLVEAAGRCFKDNNDFALFYKVAVKQDCSKMYWMRAIWRILSLREYAPDIMERSHAEKFVKEALKVMKEEANQNRYANRFFQAVRMFLYVLRFRIKEPNFLSYDSPTDKQLFDKIIKCLEVVQRHRIQATQLIEEIKKYMKYEGTTTINFEGFCIDGQG